MFESFATVWEAIADATPDADALVQSNRRVSWRDFDARAARLATALAAIGVGPGTHVALYLHNAPELAETLFACAKLRAVAATVNFRYAAREVERLLDDADADVVVYHRSLSNGVAAAWASLPRVRAALEVDDRDGEGNGEDVARAPNALRYEDLIASAEPAPRVDRDGADHVLWYTGGTTGPPKGVVWEQGTLLHYGIEYGAALLGETSPATVADAADAAHARAIRDRRLVTLVTTPLVHASAAFQLDLGLSMGGTVVMLPAGHVDGDDICRTIERERVVLLSVVGDAVLRRVVDALERAEERGDPYDLSSLRRIHSSGAMASVASKDAIHRRTEVSFYDSLGASESVGFGSSLTTTTGEAMTARFRLGSNARVLDADDRDVVPGSGAAGVLAVRGSTGTAYHKDPERSAATFREIDGERYAMLGDWAVPHTDGTITFLGRGSGCINSGGEKVWPEEVEETLKAHPAVHDALVVGLPDEEWGELVAAVVAAPRAGDSDPPTENELRDWVAARLARYKCPRRVVVLDEVVRTRVGKPDYPWARAQFDA